jgi:hypothetical protein
MPTSKIIIAILSLLLIQKAYTQKIISNYINQPDSLKTGPGEHDFLPYNKKGYTLILPASNAPIKGVLISLDDHELEIDKVPAQGLIHPEANDKGFAVLYVSSGIPVDLFFNKSSILYIDTVLKSVFTTYKLANKNIFFLGNMASGHRALKYIEFCRTEKSAFNPDIKGVVLCESALDWVRQWYECQKQMRDHLNEVQFFEGKFITYLFNVHFKNTPATDIEQYLRFSAYSYFDTTMRNIRYFKDIPVRAYSFAPVNYWFSANGKGVYDCNFPDMEGIVNELKLAGNKNAELIVFSNETRAPATTMERQSNTWNLIDKKELIQWCLSSSK